MHGSKFIEQESFDPKREAKLLASAVNAIAIILGHLHYTNEAFHSAAP